MAQEQASRQWGGQNVVGKLRRVLVYSPVPADGAASWEDFSYLRPMDHALAVQEHETFRGILRQHGADVVVGEIDNPALQDAIFPFDPVIITDAGAVLCRMGKSLREREVDLAEETMKDLGIPIVGRINSPGMVEGGDCLWVDEKTLAMGRGYRTNTEGIEQMTEILAPLGIDVLTVDLPHWHGPSECLHLLSLISMIDDNLAAVYLPLMSVDFINRLRARSIEFVEVPDDEFESQGPNILVLEPRVCLLLEENQETAKRLRAAGCSVTTYQGNEISHNRTGGPTCLTRPLLRDRTSA